MAKRKRLTPANPLFLETPPETPDMPGPMRAPIADVAADSSARAALEQVAGELARARSSGHMLIRVPLEQIDQSYLVRDRMVVNEDEMQALVTSIRERGQQTPVEVTPLGEGRYGLISGWRRCQALGRIRDGGGGDATVLALERHPQNASDAYRAMVEENEIRAGLSYFERARIVDVAFRQGVFDSHKKALQSLFAAASRPKRSKIGSFVIVVQMLGDRLRHPEAIGERLGLRLARLLDLYEDEAEALMRDLDAQDLPDQAAEQAFLAGWVSRVEAAERTAVAGAAQGEAGGSEPVKSGPVKSGPVKSGPVKSGAVTSEARQIRAAPGPQESRPGKDLLARYHPADNRLEISGPGLTDDLRRTLLAWLAERPQ